MTTDLERAVEAARRIERERYIGGQFVSDARTVARALLALALPLPPPPVERKKDA